MVRLSNEEMLSEVKGWKRSPGRLIWWADTDGIGADYFSFDKKKVFALWGDCLLYTSPSPRDLST